MAAPIIRSNGSSSGIVTGTGRNTLVQGETVTLTDTEPANSGASYQWSFKDKPLASSATITNPTSPTASFIPDITGSFWVKCIVNGGLFSQKILSVPLATTGARLPAFLEEAGDYDGGGNIRGWNEADTAFKRQADAILSGASTDEKAKASSADTTPGFLTNKIAAGTNVTKTILNPGANEQVQLAVASAAPSGSASGDLGGTYPSPTVAAIHETSGPTKLTIGAILDGEGIKRSGSAIIGYTATDTDEKAKVSANDTTPGYLNGKLVAGTNITLTENNDGGNETLTITGSAPDTHDVKVSANDTTPGFLNGKLVAGTNITLTENNDGSNETLTIGVTSAAPSGAASGDLGGTYPSPTVTAIHETSGPTQLTFGAVADGKFLKRVGTTVVGSAAVGATGEKLIDTIQCGTSDLNDTATPKVAWTFSFDPSQYGLTGTTLSVIFNAVAYNTDAGLTTHVKLRNLTDSDDIVTLNFSSIVPVKQTSTLTVGASAGQVDNSEKIYEVSFWVDLPDGVNDAIVLGSAELRVINTVS